MAAWIGFNFGYALLCLVGAAVFYLAASLLEGEIDLGELQVRPRGSSCSSAASGRRTRASAHPRERKRTGSASIAGLIIGALARR